MSPGSLGSEKSTVSIAQRGALFLLIWWLLTNGDQASWWIGLPAVVLVVLVSLALIPPLPIAWRATIHFVPFFLIRSLMGGIDVAWRVFHPHLPIKPDLVEYPLWLPPGLPRVVMANIVSLLPGTLAAELDHSGLTVHVLDRGNNFKAELVKVEEHVARLFGLSREADSGGQ